MNLWEMAKIAARCEEAMGMRVRQVFDMEEVSDILAQLEKGYLSPILDPEKNDFTPANSFWLVAESAGTPVIAGGVRCDDLRHVTINDFWAKHLTRAFGTKPQPVGPGFAADGLSGRVAYFGDLKSNGKTGLSKMGRDKIRYFTAIGHYLTQQEFAPDITYCFIQERDAMRGTPSNYGFLQLDPFFYEWEEQPYPAGAPEWVASLRRDQLPLLMASMDRLIGVSAGSTQECTPALLHQTAS